MPFFKADFAPRERPSTRLLRYGNRPEDFFGFLTGLERTAHVASDIGPQLPDEHARRLVASVVDGVLVLADALYEIGWEDLLARLEVVFQGAGSPLDALRQRGDLFADVELADLAGELRDRAGVPGEGPARPAASAPGHSVDLSHDSSSVGGDGATGGDPAPSSGGTSEPTEEGPAARASRRGLCSRCRAALTAEDRAADPRTYEGWV